MAVAHQIKTLLFKTPPLIAELVVEQGVYKEPNRDGVLVVHVLTAREQGSQNPVRKKTG